MFNYDPVTFDRQLRAWRRTYLANRLWGALRRLSDTVVTGVRAWHTHHVTYRELASLSDWQLKDIGLHRDQLPFVAAEIARLGPQPVVARKRPASVTQLKPNVAQPNVAQPNAAQPNAAQPLTDSVRRVA